MINLLSYSKTKHV